MTYPNTPLLIPDRQPYFLPFCAYLIGVSSRTLEYTFLQGELDALWSPLHSVSSLHQLGRSMSRLVIGLQATSQGRGAEHFRSDWSMISDFALPPSDV